MKSLKTLSKLTLTITALALFISFGHAQTPGDGASAQAAVSSDTKIDPAKEAEIRKMLELTGTIKLVNQMKDQMIGSFSTQNPTIPAEFWTKFKANMDANTLIDRIIPLYDKYYSLDDLKAINAFYESPAGQRLVTAMPQLMRESMQIGQQWGAEIGAKVQKQIQDEKGSQAGG